MLVELTPLHCRILGVLLEKQVTTPDQYPLSLNALTLGCNQKSSREPIMALSETEVQQGLDELQALKQVTQVTGFGSRVIKYQQRFCNTEFGDLQLNPQQLAIICVLFLRGAQTPGELRTRCTRMAEFDNAVQVEQSLITLQDLGGEALVVRLPTEPGKREARYMHTFCQEAMDQVDITQPLAGAGQVDNGVQSRIAALEETVNQLQQKLTQLEEKLNAVL